MSNTFDAVAWAAADPESAARVVIRARQLGGDSANAMAVLMDAVGTDQALTMVELAEAGEP